MKKLIAVMIMVFSLMVMTSCTGNGAGQMKDSDIEKIYKTVCSADEALALAKSSPVAVFEFKGCTSGKETWNDFYRKVSEGKAASVLCAHYYTLDKDHISEELYEQEKDLYPELYFYLIKFDGKKYTIDIRLSSSEQEETQDVYSSLCHYTGDAPNSDSLFEKYEYYVLTDDPDVTWDEIMRSILDSSDPSMIRHCTVYEYFTGWKGK